MKQEKGFVLYDGPSMLDGKPIVVIATMKTSNEKTGAMIQTWILRSDLNPIEASKSKADISICGNCSLRQSLGGACYVSIHQAPLAVYKSYKRGLYPDFNIDMHKDLFTKRKIRLGAYGDPASVPYKIFDDMVKLCRGHTGYTHQYNHQNFDKRYLDICMVSADTLAIATRMHKQKARTFRVIAIDAPKPNTEEVECLSESEGLSCIECGQCDGKRSDPSIYIRAHGSRSKRFLNNAIIARG